MTLGMYWCVDVGRNDSRDSPTQIEKKSAEQITPNHWSGRKQARSLLSWFQRGLRKLLRLAEMAHSLPRFAISG